MAVVDTAMGLRVAVESARRLRFEPVAPFTATNVQTAIEQAMSASNPTVTAISVASSPYTVLATDRILLVNTSGGPVIINMMPSASRGFDLQIKDDTGNAAANNITVVPNGAETIDGLAPYLMDSNYTDTSFGLQAGGYYVKT